MESLGIGKTLFPDAAVLLLFYYYTFAHFRASITLSSSRVIEHGAWAALLWAPAIEIAAPVDNRLCVTLSSSQPRFRRPRGTSDTAGLPWSPASLPMPCGDLGYRLPTLFEPTFHLGRQSEIIQYVLSLLCGRKGRRLVVVRAVLDSLLLFMPDFVGLVAASRR